jgi:prepilin peptidase CpaA
MMSSLSPVAAIFLFSGLMGLLAAAIEDVKTRIIPNHLVVFVAGAGLALRTASGLTSAFLSLGCAGAVFVILAFLMHRNLIGGGDTKLIAASTLLVPPDRIVLLLLNIALVGGLLSCLYIARFFITKNAHRAARRFVGHLSARASNRKKMGQAIPYALAIFAGVLASIFSESFQCFRATSCSL